MVDDGTLAFGEIRSPGTIANLRERPAVEVNFVDPVRRKGFRAKGKATVCPRDSEDFAAHRHRFDRWNALAERIGNIVLIDVETAKPLVSPSYDDGVTEAELSEQWAAILLSR